MSAQLVKMLGKLKVELTAARQEQEQLALSCQKKEKMTEAQVQESERKRAQAGEDLSTALGDLGTIESGRDLKTRERDGVVHELQGSHVTCDKQAGGLKAEIHEAMRLRRLLIPAARDCEVTDWKWKVCSQKCTLPGGTPGAREVVRETLSPSSQHGRACPPLKAQVPCGAKQCPTDCKLGEWESWTACSAPCGGGTRSRTRPVEAEPKHGGVACPGQEERQSCNVGGCNTPCTLAEWSGWGSCSRACRFSSETPTGRQQRKRGVAQPPKGSGSCQPETDPMRLNERPCNKDLCGENATCFAANQEVLVLLDGSSAANFEAQLQLMRGVVEGAAEGMRFGLVVYGASVQVLSEATSDRAALLGALDAAQAPGGAPDLAKAESFILNMAQAKQGTTGGPGLGTVVLLVDGTMTLLEPAIGPAQKLRELGLKLLLGLVDGSASNSAGAGAARSAACRLAGEPCAAHLETASSWRALASSPMRFLAALCDTFSKPAPPAGSKMLNFGR